MAIFFSSLYLSFSHVAAEQRDRQAASRKTIPGDGKLIDTQSIVGCFSIGSRQQFEGLSTVRDGNCFGSLMAAFRAWGEAYIYKAVWRHGKYASQ